MNNRTRLLLSRPTIQTLPDVLAVSLIKKLKRVPNNLRNGKEQIGDDVYLPLSKLRHVIGLRIIV